MYGIGSSWVYQRNRRFLCRLIPYAPEPAPQPFLRPGAKSLPASPVPGQTLPPGAPSAAVPSVSLPAAVPQHDDAADLLPGPRVGQKAGF